MRHYCLGGRSAPSVCARRSRPVRGGSGRHLASCLFRFPLLAPRVPRCVWRAVPSGCPLPSLAGTPFHAVCAFRALGPVALPVVPACPFRVCALALSRCPLPPPLGGVARASRVVPALGAGRAVPRGPCPSACPAPVPCSVWRAWGGAVRSRFPPTWLGVVGAAAGRPRGGAFDRCVGRLGSYAPPPPTARPLGGLSGSALWARACGCGGPALSLWGLRAAGRVHGVLMLGGGLGGGGGRALFPRAVRPGRGLLGGGSLCLFPSLCLPWAGNKAGVTGVVLSMGGVAPHTTPVRAHPASLGTICAASRCAGVGPLVHRGTHVSQRLGRGGGSHSGSPLGRGGAIPPASGGGGRGPRGWRAGGRAGGGGCRAAASLLSSRSAACGTPFWPSPCRRRAPFRRARAVGVEVPPRGGGG